MTMCVGRIYSPRIRYQDVSGVVSAVFRYFIYIAQMILINIQFVKKKSYIYSPN